MKEFVWKIVYPLSITDKKNVFERIPEEYKGHLQGRGRESYEFFYELVTESSDMKIMAISTTFLQRIPSFSKYQKRMRRSYSDDMISSSFDYEKTYKMIQFLLQTDETWLFLAYFE